MQSPDIMLQYIFLLRLMFYLVYKTYMKKIIIFYMEILNMWFVVCYWAYWVKILSKSHVEKYIISCLSFSTSFRINKLTECIPQTIKKINECRIFFLVKWRVRLFVALFWNCNNWNENFLISRDVDSILYLELDTTFWQIIDMKTLK